jgi:glyoxylase-like metal-dependent hydrolase (beta-lactamase superfamily II)
MIFQQIVNEESGCLSYLIGCSEAGKALVVDPGRDRVPEYLRLAAKKGLTISHILETHTHADHISGNRDLAEASGRRSWCTALRASSPSTRRSRTATRS